MRGFHCKMQSFILDEGASDIELGNALLDKGRSESSKDEETVKTVARKIRYL